MAVRLRLAALGHTMERGKVVEWYAAEGGRIEQGAPLYSVETDKATVDVEAPAGGVLLRIDAEVDREYPVGATLAWIGESDESLPDRTDETVAAPEAVSDEQRVTPVARRLAERHGVDADRLEGTGPGGRVTKEDVQRAIDAGTAPPLEKKASGEPEHDVIPLTAIRRVTAERLSAHWAGAPQVTEGIDIDMTEMRAFRNASRGEWRAAYGLVPSLNDILLKAVAAALEAHPALNSAFVNGEVHRYREVNLGVAIDVEDGLVVPVLRNAGKLGLGRHRDRRGRPGRAGQDRQALRAGFRGRDLHGQQPGGARRGLVHPGAEPAAMRDPRRRQDAAHARRRPERGRGPRYRDLRAHLRPPRAGRRPRRPLPRKAQAPAGIAGSVAVFGAGRVRRAACGPRAERCEPNISSTS